MYSACCCFWDLSLHLLCDIKHSECSHLALCTLCKMRIVCYLPIKQKVKAHCEHCACIVYIALIVLAVCALCSLLLSHKWKQIVYILHIMCAVRTLCTLLLTHWAVSGSLGWSPLGALATLLFMHVTTNCHPRIIKSIIVIIMIRIIFQWIIVIFKILIIPSQSS